MKIAAGQFKTRCLKLMDDVYKGHEAIIITKYGKPIAKLIPTENRIDEQKKFKTPILELLEGMITISGDITRLMGEKWIIFLNFSQYLVNQPIIQRSNDSVTNNKPANDSHADFHNICLNYKYSQDQAIPSIHKGSDSHADNHIDLNSNCSQD